MEKRQQLLWLPPLVGRSCRIRGPEEGPHVHEDRPIGKEFEIIIGRIIFSV